MSAGKYDRAGENGPADYRRLAESRISKLVVVLHLCPTSNSSFRKRSSHSYGSRGFWKAPRNPRSCSLFRPCTCGSSAPGPSVWDGRRPSCTQCDHSSCHKLSMMPNNAKSYYSTRMTSRCLYVCVSDLPDLLIEVGWVVRGHHPAVPVYDTVRSSEKTRKVHGLSWPDGRRWVTHTSSH